MVLQGNVLFILDSGTPYTFMSEEAFNSLNKVYGEGTDFNINGKYEMVLKSKPNKKFSHVNILGVRFLAANQVNFNFDGLTKKAILRFL